MSTYNEMTMYLEKKTLKDTIAVLESKLKDKDNECKKLTETIGKLTKEIKTYEEQKLQMKNFINN